MIFICNSLSLLHQLSYDDLWLMLLFFRCNAALRIHPYWWLHRKGHITTWIKHYDFGYGSWCAYISLGEQKGTMQEVLVQQMVSSLTTDSKFVAAAISGRLIEQSRTWCFHSMFFFWFLIHRKYDNIFFSFKL